MDWRVCIHLLDKTSAPIDLASLPLLLPLHLALYLKPEPKLNDLYFLNID